MLKKIIYIVDQGVVVDTFGLVVAAAGWPGCTLVLFSIRNNTLTEVTVGLH